MGVFGQDGAAVEWRGRHETVRIEPWGADSLRLAPFGDISATSDGT
jgi:hypothetical protein